MAVSRGLTALAINEDTLREAFYEKRDLFDELASGEGIRVGVMSPQMLRGPRMSRFLGSIEQQQAVRWMMVDEAHLTCEEADGWRAAYAAIRYMRARLPETTVWAAFTGTSTPAEAQQIARNLGYKPGAFVNARYSIDIPNIKYVLRFMAYPHSGPQFYDLAFLIPPSMTSPADIPRTFVFCETIDLGSRVMAFLDSLIPQGVAGRDNIIKPYNSLVAPEDRQAFIRDIADGTTLRIGICTDTCTFGLDVPCIRRTVVYGLCADFNTEKQRLCRAGRDGLPATAYSIVPDWVRELPEDEITTAQAKENAARRAKLPNVVRQWHNPTSDLCPRDVDRQHNEEARTSQHFHSESLSMPCCSQHNPDPELSADRQVIEYWVAQTARQQSGDPRKGPVPRSDRTHHALEPQMVKSLTRILTQWRGATWSKVRGRARNVLCVSFLPTSLLVRIAEKAHICTSVDRLQQVIGSPPWKYFPQYGEALVGVISEAMKGFDEIFEAREAMEGVNVGSRVNEDSGTGKDSESTLVDLTNTVEPPQTMPQSVRLTLPVPAGVKRTQESVAKRRTKRLRVNQENTL